MRVQEQGAALRRCGAGVMCQGSDGRRSWGGTGWVAYSFLLRWLVISKIGWLWPVEERASIASVPVYCHMAKAVRAEARAEVARTFSLAHVERGVES